MLNLCVLEFVRNENGFLVAAQSAATACLRSCLKGRGVHSIAYTDDTLPSLNDLAEDVLSIADDGLVLVANAENKLLVNALACRITQLEDLPIYLLYGGSDLNCQAEETVTTIDDGAPEETLAELLGAAEGQPLMKCSPYAQQVILPRDAEKFGIWFGRVRPDGSLEYRDVRGVATDVEKIEEAFHGLHQEERKTVPCSGLHFRDKTYLAQVLACFSQNEAPLRYHCPVSGSILEACPDDLDAVAWDISLEADWNLTKEAAELERLLQAGKLAAVTLDGALLAQPHPIWQQLVTAAEQGQLQLTVHGTIPDTADLAWGSLLAENHTVRLSGQDCQRGTFSQRHAVLHDFNDGSLYTPLEKLNHGTTAFRIYNSSLSEASVLGFEYGYALESPDALVMWEAQFGDFANGAQVIVDQFIAAAEAKWRQKNRMVLLLPHGYEGAGSEHSSARMERYLQLCADDNMQVINPTTPAQYFHALRRQVHRNLHKPLIVFTPKSLLSRPDAVSPHREFLAPSRFREVLPDPDAPAPDQVTRAVFCTGKVYYDLAACRKERNIADTVIIRLEQIYPLAREQLTFLLAPYQKVRDFVWCQEEPSNMGAWGHLRNRLGHLFAPSFRYAGRPPMACPAEGAKALHAAAQKRLLAAAFGPRTQS